MWEKIENLLCSAIGTACHWHWLEVCIVCGRFGSVGLLASPESAKVAFLLEACTKEECSVIGFLAGRGKRHHCNSSQLEVAGAHHMLISAAGVRVG
jgi:hypothetical protein